MTEMCFAELEPDDKKEFETMNKHIKEKEKQRKLAHWRAENERPRKRRCVGEFSRRNQKVSRKRPRGNEGSHLINLTCAHVYYSVLQIFTTNLGFL